MSFYKKLHRQREVIIYTASSTGVTGTVTKIEDNWIELEDKSGNKQIVNTDYISRIQEYIRATKRARKNGSGIKSAPRGYRIEMSWIL